MEQNRRVLATWSELAPLSIQAHAGVDCTLSHLLRLGLVDLIEPPHVTPPTLTSSAKSGSRGSSASTGGKLEVASSSDALLAEPLVVLKPMEEAIAVARRHWVELPDASANAWYEEAEAGGHGSTRERRWKV